MRQRLLKYLRERAPDSVDVPILQPADLFLDAGGEDLRRRIYMSQSGDGTDLCLRPEFTIPICKAHIERSTVDAARYAYGGVVFRQSREGTNEFDQVGLEDLGRHQPGHLVFKLIDRREPERGLAPPHRQDSQFVVMRRHGGAHRDRSRLPKKP